MALDVPQITRKNIVQIVRQWIRDHAELNRLLAGQETGDKLIATCVAKALDRYNNYGPPVPTTLEEFPSLSLLMDLTVCEILSSVILVKIRNSLTYSDGATVNTEGNVELYERALARMQILVERQMGETKVTQNVMAALGGSTGRVSSEYGQLSGWIAEFDD
jgi:hypothetical protein